jgi:8-oxo-dGTP pyrophosphatase MutT (NUDIX family)/2'-5' RNA ligase
MAIKVTANLRPWGALQALIKAGDGSLDDVISQMADMASSDPGIEIVTRYGTGADAFPDPATLCPGDCEGMGVVPIKLDYLEGPDLEIYLPLWEAAEAVEPDPSGWHFVPCPTCGGSGKPKPEMTPEREAIYQAVGEASMAWSEVPTGVFDTTKAEEVANALADKILAFKAGKKSIVFDFDGTICTEVEFPAIGEPIWETIERMQSCKDAGIEVVIQSCRWSEHELSTVESAAEHLVEAKAWLDKYEVPYDRLVAGKPLGELYVDDKACPVTDYQKLDDMIVKLASSVPVDGSLKAYEYAPKFWISPDGSFMEFPGDQEHINHLPDDDEDTVWTMESTQDAGWTRGGYSSHAITIDVKDVAQASFALDHIPQEKRFVDVVNVLLDGKLEQVSVLEGEDALDAWKRRNDIRHRVKAAFNGLDLDSMQKAWATPEGELLFLDPGELHAYYFMGDDDDEGGTSEALISAYENGWSRVWFGNDTLGLDPGKGVRVESVLKAIDEASPEWTLVKTLYIGESFDGSTDDEVPVLEGEDALSAWNHRKDIRHRVKAGLSPIVYHLTSVGDAANIISEDRFLLAPAARAKSEQESKPKGKYFFLSTARSPQSRFFKNYGRGAILVLDGDALGHNYKGLPTDYWGPEFRKADPQSTEMEDRVWSTEPEIPNATKYIKEIHLLLEKEGQGPANTYYGVSRKTLLTLETAGVPCWIYGDKKDFLLMNTAKAIPISQVFPKEDTGKAKAFPPTEDEPKDEDEAFLRKHQRAREVEKPNLKQIPGLVEMIKLDSYDDLSDVGKKSVGKLLQHGFEYDEYARSVENDLKNIGKQPHPSVTEVVKAADDAGGMKKLIENLRAKWRPQLDVINELREITAMEERVVEFPAYWYRDWHQDWFKGKMTRLKDFFKDNPKALARLAKLEQEPKEVAMPVAAAWVDEGFVNGKWGSSASGVLFLSSDNRVLLLKRSGDVEDPGFWGIPGGAIPVDDQTGEKRNSMDSALAEAEEELGGIPAGATPAEPVVFKDGDFTFETFLFRTPDSKFEAGDLGWESDNAAWFPLSDLPSPLHPGVKWAIGQLGLKAHKFKAKEVNSFQELLDLEYDDETYKQWCIDNLDDINNILDFYEQEDGVRFSNLSEADQEVAFQKAAKQMWGERWADVAHDLAPLIRQDTIELWRRIDVQDQKDFVWKLTNEQTLEGYEGIGPYWSYVKSAAAAHWSKGGAEVLLHGTVEQQDVDWYFTGLAELSPSLGDQEKEIRLKDGAPVRIDFVEVDGEGIDLEHPVVLNADLKHKAHVRKRGNKWVVTNKAGDKTLGTHDSKESAQKQLAAIEIHKHAASALEPYDAGKLSACPKCDGVPSAHTRRTNKGVVYGIGCEACRKGGVEALGDPREAIAAWEKHVSENRGKGRKIDIRHSLKASYAKKGWFYDKDTFISWDTPQPEGKYSHSHNLPTEVEYSSKKKDDQYQEALDAGFIPVMVFQGDELNIGTMRESEVEDVLKGLPSEWLIVEWLMTSVTGFDQVPVLEGEDALDAWEHRKDIRHRVKAAGSNKFWFNIKTGALIYTDIHYGAEEVMSKYDFEEDDPWGGVEMAMNDGWARGYNSPDELGLTVANEYYGSIEKILSKLPSEFLFVKNLFVEVGYHAPMEGMADPENEEGGYLVPAIPILEGEDALDAWKHRKDIRHRVKAGNSDGKFWISPTGDYFDVYYSHAEWVATEYETWSKYDPFGVLKAKIDIIDKEEGDEIPNYDKPYEPTFIKYGWARVDGDGLMGYAKSIPNMKKFVRESFLPDDREQKIYAEIIDGEDFEGRAMDFMSWDGTLQVKASGDTHEWGCLMVDFPKDISDEIVTWTKENIPDESLYNDPEDPTGYGRESNIHTTVVYGLDPKMDRDEIKRFLGLVEGPIKVKLGKISKFEPEKYDVIKIEIESQNLHEMHEKMKESLGAPGETYPEYKPHLTLAYVEKGTANDLLGLEPFAGLEFDLTKFDYSCPPEPGTKDKHTKYDLENLKASLKAADFDSLRKAALDLIENDPTWKSMLDNPESAQALGKLQQSIRDARSEEELKQAWESHMDLPWEAVSAESGGRKKSD